METAESIQKTFELDSYTLKKAAYELRAINNKFRQQLLKMLHENGGMNVTEIHKKMRIEQPVASQHLAILRSSGFVLANRDGKSIVYSINYSRLEHVIKQVELLLSVQESPIELYS